jgi:hypothetical protein
MPDVTSGCVRESEVGGVGGVPVDGIDSMNAATRAWEKYYVSYSEDLRKVVDTGRITALYRL